MIIIFHHHDGIITFLFQWLPFAFCCLWRSSFGHKFPIFSYSSPSYQGDDVYDIDDHDNDTIKIFELTVGGRESDFLRAAFSSTSSLFLRLCNRAHGKNINFGTIFGTIFLVQTLFLSPPPWYKHYFYCILMIVTSTIIIRNQC